MKGVVGDLLSWIGSGPAQREGWIHDGNGNDPREYQVGKSGFVSVRSGPNPGPCL